MTRRPSVLITGVGGRSVGHQILHALLLLQDRYQIVCCDADSYAFGLYQVADRYVVPSATNPAYLPAILEIIRRHGINILLPGTEAEIRILVQCRDQLAAAGCLLVASPPDVITLCSDKGKLYQWLADQGIGVPRSAGITDWRDLVQAVGFPVVAKPAGFSGGSRNVEILADDGEVDDYILRFPGPSAEIVFQEYVGDATSEYTVGVVIGKDGGVIDSIVLHRHLVGLSLGTTRVIRGKQYALSTGYSQGFIIRHPQIQTFCENLSVRMGMRGPVNIQLRLHGTDIKVFEIHPRFSGTTSIRGDAGLNEPDLVIRDHLLGERIGRPDYRSDVAAIRAFKTILVPMADMAAVEKLPTPKD